MIVDVSIGLVLLIFLVKGFRSGFLPSLFALLGYIVGGFLGLLGAREVTSEWVGIWSVVGLHLLLIFIGAKIGQTIFRSIGKGVRGFVGPLKFLDSALGAVLALGQGVLIVFIGVQVLGVFSSESVQEALQASRAVGYLESHTPKLVNEGFSKLRELTD